MSELPDLFQRATSQFRRYVQQVGADQWSAATPCTDWDVRALVNHLVYEARWAPPLLEGQTIADVGDRFEGDLLGDDPKASYDAATAEAVAAVRAVDLGTIVHLSYADVPASDYVSQLTADFSVHAWDLARGINADDDLEPELVTFTLEYAEPQKDALAGSGMFGTPIPVADDADAQTKLLAMFGRKR